MNKISIIIPVFNEVETVPNLLDHLFVSISGTYDFEVILVDGGSTDGSQDAVRSYIKRHRFLKNMEKRGKVVLCVSPKGRAKQMNLGAHHAKGNIFYFLHADSLPPKHFDQLIISEVEKGNQAGCFRMRFDSNHWWLKLAGWLTALPWRICRGGDQSQFITRKLFDGIGGYDERFSVYEDNDLIKKLYKEKQFVVIQKWLTTSARCYQKHGIWKTQYHFWRIHLKKRFGASASELSDYYKKNLVNT